MSFHVCSIRFVNILNLYFNKITCILEDLHAFYLLFVLGTLTISLLYFFFHFPIKGLAILKTEYPGTMGKCHQ